MIRANYIYDAIANTKARMKILFLVLSVAAPVPVLAANFDIQPIPDLPLSNLPASTEADTSAGTWRFTLGGGLSYAPRYEGAVHDRLRFMPLLDATYKNGKFFASPLRGVGYNFSGDRDAQYGVRLTPGKNRRESADSHLTGMGNIGFTPEAGLFYNQRFAPWYISSAISTGDHGTHAELGSGIGFALSPTDRLRVGVNLMWGDSKYNQTYFGVTPAQATASGNVLTAFNASSGVKDYALTGNWLHSFDRKWFSNAGVSYKWLTGSAKQSPLTQRRAASSVNYLVGYRF
jgi:outer membrane scaffolding protein for murein synthesis (MipA/OmpV family)